MRIVLLGPPGAGKGTQATQLASQYGLSHLSTGDLFRAAYREGDPLGLEAHDAISRGELVADEIVIGLVKQRLSRTHEGWLLDGFPRTREQAKSLDAFLKKEGEKLDCVLSIVVGSEELIGRLQDRRICKDCGRSYHLKFKPPTLAGQCDICGGELYQRSDDRPAAIRNRLQVYEKETAPLVEYYKAKGLLREVDGEGSMDRVYADVQAAIEAATRGGS